MNASDDGPPAVPATPADGAADGPAPSALRRSSGSWRLISGQWPYAARRTIPMPVPPPGAGTTAAEDSAADAPDPVPSRVISPPARPRWSGMRGLLGALAALIFLSGSALILSRLVTQPDTTRSPTGAWTTPQTATPTPTSPAPTGPVFVEPTPIPSASTTTRTKSPALAFELVGSVPELHVTVGPLGTEPVRASTPNGSAPRATVDGDTVRLVVPANGGDRLDVRLNERIAWAVRVSGGVRSASFELAGATLRRLDLAGGAALLEMALPAEKQTIPIRMSGGVNTWRITTARKVPVRVVLRRGGGEVVLNGHSVHGVARNTTLNDRVAGSGAAGLDIEAVAGLGTLTIGTRGTP